MKDSQKIGYFGGTFDPPHLGHVILAREALYQLNLDAVMWLITPDPPHKIDREITPLQHRLEMLELVTDRYEEFSISEIDLQRTPPYYAADTAEIIKTQKPGVDLVYIIGEDSLEDLPGWYQPNRLLNTIDLLAVSPRPGFNPDLAALEKELPGLIRKTVFLANVMVEISSSIIRKRVREGNHYDHFLIREVADYIYSNHLYHR